MTQEDKALLLKDLCARLPYGVKCEYYNNISGRNVCKISNNGTSYCYLTVFGNICVETRQYRKTPCFRVYKEENKEE